MNEIKFKNEGYVRCKSRFYCAEDGVDGQKEYIFHKGINNLIGEIDSDIWGISYLLSMYKCSYKDIILFDKPVIYVDEKDIPLENFMKYSCYMDEGYPMFSTHNSVRKLVEKGIKKSGISNNPEEIRELFQIDKQRFERQLSGVGNEIFKAMAAIGYCNGKQVYCFPWLSKKRFEYYHRNITDLLEILESLGAIIIVPIGK